MPQLFEDPNVVAPSQGGIALTPGENVPGVALSAPSDSGIGVSSTADVLRGGVDEMNAAAAEPSQPAPRVMPQDSVRARFESLSGLPKLGAVLSEFGAGVTGKDSPMKAQIEQERKDRTLKVAEDKEKLTTFVDGMKALSTIPAGKEREEVAAKMAPHMGDMGDAFLALSKQPDYSAKLLDHAKDSPTLARSIEVAGVPATLKLMGTEAFNKTVNSEIDARRMPIVQQTVKTLLAAAPTLDKELAADIKKRGYATHADIVTLNEKAEKELPAAALKPTDMAILNQHAEGVYAGVSGTLGPAGAKQALLASIEKNQPTAFMREAETLHGKDTPAYYAAIQRHLDRMDAPTQVQIDAGNAKHPVGDFSKSGDDFLKSLPESDRALVKKIANYDIDPKTLSTRGGHREKMLTLASQYNPDYDDTQYANKRKAIQSFGTGKQGDTVRSLNVAIEHVDTLKRAATALNNGDLTGYNKVSNEVAKFFGKAPPNTFEGLRDMVANEVVKGTIGNAGALMDRQEAAAKVKASSSPQQLADLFNGWTELMGGQVKGLEQQYESSTGLKDFRQRHLRERTRDAIALAERKAGGAVPAGATPAPPAGFKPL